MRDICGIRSDTYFCFSLCFDYPTATMVEPATVKTIAETINSLAQISGLETLSNAANLFNAELERSVDVSGVPLLHLQIEYNRLFAGPSKPQVYPYEGAFLNESGWAVDTGRNLVREYLEGGLKLAPGFKDSPDHVSLEFEFMSRLCEKEMKERETRGPSGAFTYQQRQRLFLENHIVNWVPAFLATVERSAVLTFYKLLARIARGFVVWDYAHVEHLARQRERSGYVNA
jgi:TorA maturation chaperone TorD